MGSHSLLQGTFLTQRPNPGLLHCRWTPYHLSHEGSNWRAMDRPPSHPCPAKLLLLARWRANSQTEAHRKWKVFVKNLAKWKGKSRSQVWATCSKRTVRGRKGRWFPPWALGLGESGVHTEFQWKPAGHQRGRGTTLEAGPYPQFVHSVLGEWEGVISPQCCSTIIQMHVRDCWAGWSLISFIFS